MMMQCDCNFLSQFAFPDIRLVLGKNASLYVIPSTSYVTLMGWNTCSIDIMSMGNSDMWILGMNFFHNYYSIFDQEKGRVGFARSNMGQYDPLDVSDETNLVAKPKPVI